MNGPPPALRRMAFDRLPVLPYAGWRPRRPGGRLEGGPVFPADAPHWVHMPLEGGREWVGGEEALPPAILPEPVPGRFAFLGPAAQHFGHMVGEFLHRLWVLREEPALRPLIVASPPRPVIPSYVAGYLRLIGAPAPLLVDRPMEVAHLVVGEPGRLLGQVCTAAYGRMIGAMLPASVLTPRGQARDLAILRGHLQTGRCIGESWIEAELAAQGYRAFRPEEHPLEEQLAAIAGAERIILSEGSALHLFDLLPPLRARVAVIGRRPGMGIPQQCLTEKVEAPLLIRPDFIIGTLHRRNPRANAISFIDPDAVLDRLRAEGFVDARAGDRYFARPGAVEAELEIYTAHWRQAVGEAAARDFLAAARASCMARRQDPRLAAALRKTS